MYDTIIFDLGGVLIDWNPRYVFDSVFADQAERQAYFFEHICTSDWNEEQDAGRPLRVATEERIALFPDWETEIRAFYGRWEEMLGGVIPGTCDILSQIKDRAAHKLLALTNWSAETFPIAQARYECLQWFDGILVSGQEGTRKPFDDFFNLLFARFDVDPAKAIFIDDNRRNIAAGARHGLQSIWFESPAQLMGELIRLGVLPQPVSNAQVRVGHE